MAQLEAGRGAVESVEPAAPARVARRHGLAVGTDDQALEQGRRGSPRAAGAAVTVLGQDRVNLIPGLPIDDRLVLARVGGALVLDLADTCHGQPSIARP